MKRISAKQVAASGKKLLGKQGFTLIESLTAASLFVLAVTSMTSSFVAVRMHVTSARHHYQAMSVAREKMEDIIYAGISSGASPEADETVTIDVPSGLTGTQSVAYSPDPAGDDVTVTVKISWTETYGSGNQESETLVLFLNTI